MTRRTMLLWTCATLLLGSDAALWAAPPNVTPGAAPVVRVTLDVEGMH